jgi:excinuclease UvrABC ATPase subunit
VTTQPHSADAHDAIRVHGARENNLQDVDVSLPKRRLTAFTGVSGSGKSSLVFGTIAAESQRLINETYPAFVQGFMPALGRPDVDRLEGLTTAIIVDQERLGSNPRSTVGTATDANAMLRVLFSRIATPHIGGPQAYSFNVASASGAGAVTLERPDGSTTREKREFSVVGGMCPRCEGTGTSHDVDLNALYDDTLSLDEGALTIPGYKAGGWMVRFYSESGLVPGDVPIRDFTRKQLDDFLWKEPTKMKFRGINSTYASSSTAPSRPSPARTARALGCPRQPAPRRSAGCRSRTRARWRSAHWPTGCATSTSRPSPRC